VAYAVAKLAEVVKKKDGNGWKAGDGTRESHQVEEGCTCRWVSTQEIGVKYREDGFSTPSNTHKTEEAERRCSRAKNYIKNLPNVYNSVQQK